MARLAYYREAHPLVFVITHWVNLVSVFLLIVTGMVIHNPVFGGTLGLCRGIHIFCAFLLVLNMLVRIFMSFFVKSAVVGGSREMETDIHNWLPQIDNRYQRKSWLEYYSFKRNERPLGAKYGVLRKAYLLFAPLLILAMFYTGGSLWSPFMNLPPFAVGISAVGGLMNMRMLHYFMMFVFIIYVLVHVYFVSIEGGGAVRLMLFRKEAEGLHYDAKIHNIVSPKVSGETFTETFYDDDMK